MTDIFTKEKRSWVMSRIRGKNTRPEASVEAILKKIGVEYERYPKVLGTPDFKVSGAMAVVFVDGDFWHGYRMGPKRLSGMRKFWRDKIAGNKIRDRRVNAKLRRQGWTVIRVWEHDVEEQPHAVEERLARALRPIPSG